MNLDKLFTLSVAVVTAFSLTVNLDKLYTWIWRAQAKLIYESRTETWGSPRFFPNMPSCTQIDTSLEEIQLMKMMIRLNRKIGNPNTK